MFEPAPVITPASSDPARTGFADAGRRDARFCRHRCDDVLRPPTIGRWLTPRVIM